MNRAYYDLETGEIVAVSSGELDIPGTMYILTAKEHSEIAKQRVLHGAFVDEDSLVFAESGLATQSDRERGYRVHRDKRLAETDWTQVSDNALTQEQKDAWKTYRQQLRDISLQEGFPNTVVWPTLPI